MASIEGLTDEQCQQLAAVRVGNFILVESQYKQNEDERSDEDSEAESEDEEDGEDAAGDEDEEGGEDAAGDEVGEGAEHIEDIEATAEGEEEEEDEEDEEELLPLTTGLYIVLKIIKDKSDVITDIIVEQLEYGSKPAQVADSYHTYQIYGTQVEVNGATSNLPYDENDTEKFSIKHLINNDYRDDYLYVNPTGDDVRHILHRGRCPARCRRGWIRTQAKMHELVTDNLTTVTEHQPVCPVCMGKGLMQEYQTLREILESGPIDIGITVEFLGRLNPRRLQLGYNFKQFDEREWGYLFEDMDSESDEAAGHGGAGNTNGWGYWPEALDPASNPVKRPAADSVVASLPRKSFAEAKMLSEETKCPVCREEFEDDATVVQLACKHLFCGTGCIEAWLKDWNSCPTCRAKLPSKEDEDAQAQAQTQAVDDADSVLNEGQEEIEDEEDEEEDVDTPKPNTVVFSSGDGRFEVDEDVIMTDVEDLEEEGGQEWDAPRQVNTESWR